jgi:hypothetical protein
MSSEINLSMDVHQGVNFSKQQVQKVGYITKITLGKKALKADIGVAKIDDPSSDQDVVGILVNCGWDGNPSGPLGFYGVISDSNKKTVKLLLAESLVDRTCKVEFECWAYDVDEKAKKYYKEFHSNDEEIDGELVLQGGGSGKVDLWVEEVQIPDVPQPALYQMGFSMTPAPKQQKLHYSVDGTGGNLVRPYGIETK